jgi:hypothetical protein
MGLVSGLPQKHLVTGWPYRSIRTAVPACSTAGKEVMCPSMYPWLVMAVSERSTADVRPATKPGMSAGRMPKTPAQAAALPGCVCKKLTSCCGLQLAFLRVPPYRPGVAPEKLPPLPGSSLSPDWSVPTGGMNGLAPCVPTGSRVTAAGEDVGVRMSAATEPDSTSTTVAKTPMIALRENRPYLPSEPALPGLPGPGGRA